MHALVVEDNGLAARDFAERLRRHGATTVERTTTAETALLASERHQPDIALVDIGLDGPLDGLMVGEVLAQQGVAVIYVSGQIDRAALWGRNHAIDILRKPIKTGELVRALSRVGKAYVGRRGR